MYYHKPQKELQEDLNIICNPKKERKEKKRKGGKLVIISTFSIGEKKLG